MGIEYELKYRATAAQQTAIRQAFAGEETQIAMQTTYYDTPDGQLAGKRCTLRQRLENGVSVCTLKGPAQASGRDEWEIRCDTLAQALPELALRSGIVLPEPSTLIPICGAQFTRIAKLLTLPACTAELALDSGVLTGGGQEIPLREVELELKSGSQEALDALGEEFRHKFGLKKEFKSKFRRALALAKGE